MSIKLSDKDSDIIAHTCLQADVSIANIAKQTGFREHTVRNSLKRFIDLGVLKPVIVINPYVLGLTEYYVFFAIDNSIEAYEKALHVLSSSEDVFWLGEVGSSYRFAASILANGPSGLMRILHIISTKLGNSLRERHVTTCYSFYSTSPSVFSKKKVGVPSLWYGDTEKIVTIDAVDHVILRTLSKAPITTLRELSAKIGVPISTVEYRLKNLRVRGVITGYEYLIDYQKIGLSVFHLGLYLSKNTDETHKRILKFAIPSGNISYVGFLIGRWDVELGVVVHHPRDVSALLSELYVQLGSDVSRIEFYPTVKYLKLEYYPFEKFIPRASE